MNFDDQDWEVGEPPGEELRGISTAWKVGAGFALGLALGGALVHFLDRQVAQNSARVEAGATIERLLRNTQPSAAGAPAAAPMASDRSVSVLPEPAGKAAEVALPVPRAEPAATATADIEAESSAAAVFRAARQAAERKARDWARIYKKPPQCDDNPNRDVMIECANHYIRAKRQFEESYGAGKRTVVP